MKFFRFFLFLFVVIVIPANSLLYSAQRSIVSSQRDNDEDIDLNDDYDQEQEWKEYEENEIALALSRAARPMEFSQRDNDEDIDLNDDYDQEQEWKEYEENEIALALSRVASSEATLSNSYFHQVPVETKQSNSNRNMNIDDEDDDLYCGQAYEQHKTTPKLAKFKRPLSNPYGVNSKKNTRKRSISQYNKNYHQDEPPKKKRRITQCNKNKTVPRLKIKTRKRSISQYNKNCHQDERPKKKQRIEKYNRNKNAPLVGINKRQHNKRKNNNNCNQNQRSKKNVSHNNGDIVSRTLLTTLASVGSLWSMADGSEILSDCLPSWASTSINTIRMIDYCGVPLSSKISSVASVSKSKLLSSAVAKKTIDVLGLSKANKYIQSATKAVAPIFSTVSAMNYTTKSGICIAATLAKRQLKNGHMFGNDASKDRWNDVTKRRGYIEGSMRWLFVDQDDSDNEEGSIVVKKLRKTLKMSNKVR